MTINKHANEKDLFLQLKEKYPKLKLGFEKIK